MGPEFKRYDFFSKCISEKFAYLITCEGIWAEVTCHHVTADLGLS